MIRKREIRTFIVVSLAMVLGMVGGSYLTLSLQPSDQEMTQAVVEMVSTETSVDLTLADVVAAISSSVVEINTLTETRSQFGRSTTTSGAGSGVIVASDGDIVTNYHVIQGAETITVRLSNGNEYRASVVATDESNDLALIHIDESGLNAVVFGDSDTLRVGQTTIAIGNPLGTLGGTVTEGILSATDREITIDDETYILLQTSAAINSGNSGGGLFDDRGVLIGIVNAKSSGLAIEGLGFAIPVNTVVAFLDSI